MSSVALDTMIENQAAQLNLLLYQIYRPYFNGKKKEAEICEKKSLEIAKSFHLRPKLIFAHCKVSRKSCSEREVGVGILEVELKV